MMLGETLNPGGEGLAMRDIRGAVYSFRFSIAGFIVIMLVLWLVPTKLSSPFVPGSAGYTPLISLVTSTIETDLLPHGWLLIAIHPNEPLEIDVGASAVFAFLLDSPIFSFDAARFMLPADQKTAGVRAYPFAILTFSLFALGTLVGRYFVFYQLQQIVGFNDSISIYPLFVDAASYYFLVLRSIAAIGFAFMFLGVAYMLFRFRIDAWHATVSPPGLAPISKKINCAIPSGNTT
jgi:Sec-independent protein secretion pathway component TatC